MTDRDALAAQFDRALGAGRLDDAAAIAIKVGRQVRDPIASATAARMSGKVAVARGDNALALSEFTRAVDGARTVGRLDLLADGWLTDLGSTLLTAGEADRAVAEKRQRPHATRTETPGPPFVPCGCLPRPRPRPAPARKPSRPSRKRRRRPGPQTQASSLRSVPSSRQPSVSWGQPKPRATDASETTPDERAEMGNRRTAA